MDSMAPKKVPKKTSKFNFVHCPECGRKVIRLSNGRLDYHNRGLGKKCPFSQMWVPPYRKS